jgi:hypothetical protein
MRIVGRIKKKAYQQELKKDHSQVLAELGQAIGRCVLRPGKKILGGASCNAAREHP